MLLNHIVAPHAGAWIETKGTFKWITSITVAPHAGAWIETKNCQKAFRIVGVAPHAGAWVETYDILKFYNPKTFGEKLTPELLGKIWCKGKMEKYVESLYPIQNWVLRNCCPNAGALVYIMSRRE